MKNKSLTKLELSKILSKKKGYSTLYSKKIIDDFFEILKISIKENNFKLKNIGSFKLLDKNSRIGRNPKTREMFTISSRRTISFIQSKKLINFINNY